MPRFQHPRLRAVLPLVVPALLCTSLAGCGGGASSPQQAVSRLLAPFGKPVPNDLTESQRRDRVRSTWHQMCEGVDPKIRRGLHTDITSGLDAASSCGAVVSLLVAYVGDGAKVGDVARITGNPRSAVTSGDTSVVTVTMHYEPHENLTVPPPPRTATINVLVVRRGGGWFVATPQAFNPTNAAAGGLTIPRLRVEWAEMLAAAR